MACADAVSFKFLTYQLPTVGYWPTVALTGNGELGFDSGEGARETATTSKDCLLYTSPSPRDQRGSRMPSSA